MDMLTIVTKIVEDGVRAPSGENCQPWRFTWNGSRLSIFNVPEADTSLYNTLQRGSYMAHGALLENISLSAKRYGYEARSTLFPFGENEARHVADVIFTPSSSEISPRYSAIVRRCTNRKDYSEEKLSSEDIRALKDSVKGFADDCIVIDDKSKMSSFGYALAVHEKVLFENKSMHDFFYDHIIWNKKDEEKAGGFFIDTLEFLPHQLKAVKLLKHWGLLKIVNLLFRVSTMISKDNGRKYAQGGGFFILTMKGDTLSDYIRLGIAMEKFWLEATVRSLAVHPCNGTLYLMRYMENGGEQALSRRHAGMIRRAYKTITDLVREEKSSTVGFVFRVGKADEPTAVAKRLPPIIEVIS